MSKYSKDKLVEIDAQIMRLIATYPNISALKISQTLDLDHHFILARKNKIHRQTTEEIKRMTVEQDLGEISNFIKVIIPTLSGIIFDNNANDKNKIAAAKTLIEGKAKLLGMKFDAGIFQKQLGIIKTENMLGEEEKKLIKEALNYAFEPDKPTKDNRTGQ